MCEIQSTEASTQLSAVLDAVERGETFAIMRQGRRIARLIPEPEHQREQAVKAVEALRAFGNRNGPISTEDLVSARREGQRG